MTYSEFTKDFPNENSAIDFIVATKYRDGFICPKCRSVHKRVYHQKYDRRKFYCSNCKSEFSALKGTIFENTHLDLRMWLYAINLLNVSQQEISALQLKRELGMGSYQSAWRMLHQIRSAMENNEYTKTIEVITKINNTYVGGKSCKENNLSGKDNNDENKSKQKRVTFKTSIIKEKKREVVVNYNLDASKQLNGKHFPLVLKKVCKSNAIIMINQFSDHNILNRENS